MCAHNLNDKFVPFEGQKKIHFVSELLSEIIGIPIVARFFSLEPTLNAYISINIKSWVEMDSSIGFYV